MANRQLADRTVQHSASKEPHRVFIQEFMKIKPELKTLGLAFNLMDTALSSFPHI